MQPNFFIALPARIGPPSTGRLVDAAPRSVRLFHPDDHHVTLAFLGGCGEEAARRAWAAMPSESGLPESGRLGAPVALGNPKRPSALCAHIADEDAVIASFILEHRAALHAAAGARAETRKPLPHLTLARIQRRARPPEREQALRWLHDLAIEGVPVQFSPPALYTWSLDRRARFFRILEGG